MQYNLIIKKKKKTLSKKKIKSVKYKNKKDFYFCMKKILKECKISTYF